jgi:DNA replication and repair protein RecF
MLVRAVAARPLRSLDAADVALDPSITSIAGENGAGKTNLVEALYFGLTGRSFRTRDRRELIPFGESVARSEVEVSDSAGVTRTFLASVSRSEGRRHLLDGSPAPPSELAHHRPQVAVFSPDRLILVKGPPAERRAHLDAFAAARWPSRADLRKRYGQALAQRNAQLARISAGAASPADLDIWDAALAAAAAPLIRSREEAAAALAGPFTELGAELGLEGGAALSYAPRAGGDETDLAAGLIERRDADLRLGRTTWGPHLDDVSLDFGGRAIRRYASQGQQRLALLALLFAEREALLAARGAPPLMILDDVMSELDPAHRRLLGSRLTGGGQAVLTTTDPAALPEPARSAVIRMPEAARFEVVAA